MADQPRPIRYQFDADVRKFAAGAKKVESDLKGIAKTAAVTDKALDLKAKIDDTALSKLRNRLIETRATLTRSIETDVDLDASKALRDLLTLERQIRQVDRMNARPEVEVDTDGRAKRALQGLDRVSDALLRNIPVIGPALASIGPAGWAAAAGVAALTSAAASPLLAAGGAAGGLLGAKGLLEAFDSLDKAGRKSEIVFGKSLADVQEWAKGLSTDVGLGTVEITSAAASIQDLLVPQGFNRGDAAKVTQEVYERGAALAEFNGVETSQGVEAVTAAMLGQRRQLKGLGVDISAKEVKERSALLAGQAGYRGYNDKMLTTLATQQLLEEKSKDAWTAFTEGGSAADSALDTLNATLANLKTDAIEGFGGILNDIIGDLEILNGGMGQVGDLGDWIAANGEKIRGAFLDVAEFIAQSVVQLANFGTATTVALVNTAPLLATWIRGMADMASMAQKTAGAILMITPGMSSVGREMLKSADNTKRLGDSAATAYESLLTTAGPDVIAGLEGLQGGAQEALTKIQELQALDATRLKITAEVQSGNLTAARAELRTLTRPQLVTMLASLDPKSKDTTERKLHSLVKSRIAKVDAKAEKTRAEKDLKSLTKPKSVTVTPKISSSEGERRGGGGTFGLPTSIQLQPKLGSTTETQKTLKSLTSKRRVELESKLKGADAVKTKLDELDNTRYIHLYGVYHAPSTPSGSTSAGSTGSASASSVQVNRLAYTTGIAADVGYRTVTQLQPRATDATQVNVYLDSRRISSHLAAASGGRP